MSIPRRRFVAAAGALAVTPIGLRAETPVELTVGTQDIELQETVKASGVLDGLPFTLHWATLPGPAAQLSALYSRAIDVGLMGDTSLIIEQGRARTEWVAGKQPLQIIAGWRNLDRAYPPIITAVRSDSGIKSPADLRGKKWAYNFGGFNYLQYVLTRIKADLKTTDFEPVQMVDTNAAAAAFNAGRADAFSGGPGPIRQALDKGTAGILLTCDDVEIPALSVFAARGDVLRDVGKKQAIGTFLDRMRQHWIWYANHLDIVQHLYQDKLKQTEARAKYDAPANAAIFRPLDDDLMRREQHIADVLLASGDITRKVDVAIEFDRRFNPQTVPAG